MATKKKAPATPSVGIVLAPEPRFVTRAEAVRLVEEADRAAAAKRPSGPMYTYVGICLDRSGSMESCKSATISGFNEQIQKLRSMCNASAGEQVITTLVTFSDLVQPVFINKSVDKVEELNHFSYIPNGMTAMYDGIVDTVRLLEQEEQKLQGGANAAFLLVIMTDGMENASKRFNGSQAGELLKSKQASGKWTVVFLGANIDVNKMSQILSVPVGNTMSYESTPVGTRQAFAATEDSLGEYYNSRRGGVMAVKSFLSSDGKVRDATKVDPNAKSASK